MNKIKCPQCRGKYGNGEFYVFNGQKICRECVVFNQESIGTEKSLKVAEYLRKFPSGNTR